jgi:hypothetical protein
MWGKKDPVMSVFEDEDRGDAMFDALVCMMKGNMHCEAE